MAANSNNSSESTYKQIKIILKRSKFFKRYTRFKKKHNILRLSTKTITALAIISYLILLIFMYKWDIKFESVMQISANYVTIFAFAIGTLQLVAFVSDARQRERRAKKEAALELASSYAKDLVWRISLVINILSRAYDDKNPSSLNDSLLTKIPLNKFTKLFLMQIELNNPQYTDFSKLLKNGTSPISTDILLAGFECYGYCDISKKPNQSEDDYRALLNKKFRGLINQTLNELEYFAMSVNQNISESEMLFPSLHQTFLKFIRFTYPQICESNVSYEEYYTNIIKLYRKWYTRYEEHDKLKQNRIQQNDDIINDDLNKGNKPM